MRSFTSRVNSSQAARIQLPNNLPSASSSTAAATPTLAPHPSLPETAPALDLVGGPWAVIESDPGWPYISFVIGGFRTGTFCTNRSRQSLWMFSTLTVGLKGVFTTLMHRIGVKRCQAQEVYSVEPDGLSHLGSVPLASHLPYADSFRHQTDTYTPSFSARPTPVFTQQPPQVVWTLGPNPRSGSRISSLPTPVRLKPS